jgi:chemotaxis protein histidine kinase CheA
MGHKNLLIFLYFIFGTSAFFDYSRYLGAEARYFSEGGGFNLPQQSQVQQQQQPLYSNSYYDQLQEFIQPEQQQQVQYQPKQQQQYGYDSEQQLAQIIDELNARSYENDQAKAAQELEQAVAQQQYLKQEPEAPKQQQQQHDDAYEQLQQLTNEVKQIAETASGAQPQQAQQHVQQIPQAAAALKGEQESVDSAPAQAKSEQPLTPMKKGQSEFVEFIEPPQSSILKGVESMDKRVVVSQSSGSSLRGVKLLSSTGNIMFIAVVTVCSVFVVAGVVGGAYYYNNSRKNAENDFDDFTRYSPAGPGKKLQGFRNGIRMDENGDDSLAYKAQLHHYQQTKQKIIGAEDGLSPSTTPTGGMSSPRSIHHNENSEDEAEDLEEHNYSVYECPGLAPTGDIEVSNPNFGHH